MKKCFLVLFVSFIAGFTGLSAQNRFWVAAGASNWNNTANWSATSGGAGGASVPGTGGSETPVFNANGLGNCNLDIAPVVPGITVNGYTGTINLLGNNLTTTGANTFTTGTISNTGGAASVVLNTTGLTTFNGTTFTANISGSSGRLLFNGSTFNGTVSVTKTANTNDDGTGNNTFGNSVTLQNSSANRLRMATTTRDIFNGTLNLTSNSTGALELAYSSVNNQLNGNIIITYTTPGTISFGGAAGTSTLATGRTVSIAGFGGGGCGNLYLGGLTQSGATAQTITLAGNTTALLSLISSNFAAAVALTSPRYALSATTFQGAVTLEKTDGATDNLTGGNTFQSTTLITNSGSGEFNFGNTNPDIFSNNVTLTNTSTGRIQIGVNAAGNIINGNLTVNHGGNSTANTIIGRNAGATVAITGTVTLNNSNADLGAGIIVANDADVTISGNIIVSSTLGHGIYFGNASGTVTQTAGSLTSGVYTAGNLSLSRFTQTSTAANTVTLTGSNSLIISNSSAFGGSVNFRAPILTSNGTTFNGAATLEKTGGSDNYWGGNTFQGAATITNSGSAELILGNTNADVFNGTATFNNTGSYRIRIAFNHNGQTTTFANAVTLNSNKSGGTDPWSFLVGENTNCHVTFQGSLTINVAGTLESDHRFLNGTGSIGTFNGPVTITETNTHASTSVAMGVNGPSTYAENIVVSNSGGTNGVTFNSGVTASSTLASGKTITIGGGGFTNGTLSLVRFTQLGNTPQSLTTFSGTSSLVVGPGSAFGGNVNFVSPRLFLNGCTYSGTGNFEKNGASDDAGVGGNIFTGVTTITNSGSGYLLLGNGSRDQFLSATTFNNTGSYRIYFSHSHPGQTTEFLSSLTLNTNKSGGADGWSYLVAEGTNTTLSVAGLLTINCAGTLQSNHRFLTGGGSTGAFAGLTINLTNSNASTGISMGENGTSTYSSNISVSNSGGAAGITFNTNASASSVLNGSITSGVFSSGALNLYRFSQVGSIPQTLTLTGSGTILRLGPNSSFDGDVNFVSPRLLLHGATYNGITYLEKNGASDDGGAGGNIFNGTTTLVDSGTGYLLTANNAPDIFNGDVTVNNTGSNFIYLAHNVTGNEFNGNITLNNTGTALGIRFSNNASGAATFNAGATRTISVGGSGFSTGELGLRRFTQLGSAAQTITLTGGATQLILGPTSEFNGVVSFTSPRLFLQGTTYNGTTTLVKNGAIDDASAGGNTFNGITTLTNSGSGYLLTANNAPDAFNNDVTVNNTGSNYIYLAYNVPGNQFNGNIILNNTGSALGIRFSHSTSGATTFNAGTDKTISVGGSGFSVGELGLRRFTQTGSATQTLTLTGSTTQMNLGPSSEFNGNVIFTAPRVFLNGTRYIGTAYIEKTAANADDGIGGNTFSQTATLVNSGSSYLLTGSTNPDTFNGTLILQNNSSSTIRLADNSAGNQFNGNIELNSTSGGGIYFGNNANGTSTLATGRTIAVGSSGFITGDVRLFRFTQVGPTPQTLDLGGIAILTIGPSSSFGGNVDFRAPQLYLNGTTFSGTSYLEKKGAVNNYSNGGNTFVGTSTLVHSGSGYLAMAQFSPDIFQGNLIVTNTSSDVIYLANNVTGNVFNGNITFTSTLGSQGIYIGNNATSDAILGNGASLLTGGLGFSSGELRLKRLTQIGNSNQTLTLTGTALLRIGPVTTFNGNVNFRAPQIALDGAVYNGVTYLEKTGATDNNSAGGNSFLGATTTIANSGTGFFRFALTTLDTFGAGDLILTNTGTASIRMADIVPGTVFNGNIFVNSTFGGGIFFGDGGGTASISAGRTMSVGGLGFTTGELRIRRFTQADAATPQTLILTGTAALVLGPTIAYSGAANFRAPQVYLNGGTFNGTAFIEKTGATDNSGNGNMIFQSATTLQLSGTGFFRTNGGNTFNGATSIINSGTNYVLFELATGSTYNGDLTLTNTGSSRIRTAYTGTTAYNGNIIVNSTNGTGIYFVDNGTGSATLAAGRTISVGGTGFTAGELSMPRFTQTGATAQNLVLTGTSTLRTGPTTTWNGNFTSSSPLVFLDGTTFNGTTNSITKTGTSTDGSVGGNTFAAGSTTTIANSGTGVFRLAITTADDFAGNAIFNQIAGVIQPGYNIASNFRGDVTVTSGTPIVFGANNGGAIFTGTTANQNVNKGSTASPIFRRLTMNKASGTVTMNTDAAISVTATFTSGVIHTTAANYLNFENDATTSGANNTSFVDGPVRKTGNDAFTFPIGDGAFYRPAAISAPTAVAHYFIARYFNADHGLGSAGDPLFTSISKCEYWTIDRNPGVPPAASNVLVTLSWQEAACVPGYITDPTGLRVARWNGASWVNHGNGGTTGTATNGTIVTSGAVTSFSPFTLASAVLANPLPVELTSFTASVTKSGTGLLEWHTASELNNDRFEIERSVNGVDFVKLGSVDGSGTTNKPNDYQFEDTEPVLSLVYYRLKQVDFNGEFEYSSLVPLDFTSGESNSGKLTISPNPINSGSFASFKSANRTIIQSVTVFNSVNQVVRQYSEVGGFSTEGLAPGIYIVKNKGGEIFRLVIK